MKNYQFQVFSFKRPLLVAVLSASLFTAFAADAPPPVTDRAAIERVYHEHRLGTKPPFEQAMPAALLEKLVRQDAEKEAVLARVYGVKISPEMVTAEVERINTTTRAPEILAEIKVALGNDPARFATSFAKPIIVERSLHERFENDDALHAPQRRIAETVRDALLALRQGDPEARLAALMACKEGEVQELVTWTLTPRPAEDTAAAPAAAPAPTQVNAASGPYTNEATALLAQTLSSPEKAGDRKLYFEDLPGELQNVLRVQLRQPGDVSAVIEGLAAFQVYLARERTATELKTGVLIIPKRSYEEWLAQQPAP